MITVNRSWRDALHQVLAAGREVAPRGQRTREVLGLQTRVPLDAPLLTVAERRLGYRFAPAEAAWIISGDNRVETIAPYSKEISRFSDDGIRYFGAYGPKFVDQVGYVVRTLLTDPDSRQAIINIWREQPPRTKDVPCTLSTQYLVRDGQLHVVATMRSSDLWLGWPYDVFNFAMQGWYVLLRLRGAFGNAVTPPLSQLQPGWLTLTAGSAHLYARHWEPVKDLLNGGHERPAFGYRPLVVEEAPPAESLASYLWSLAERKPRLALSNWFVPELLEV